MGLRNKPKPKEACKLSETGQWLLRPAELPHRAMYMGLETIL
ncbi:hypothetical protein F441_12827 [Phytophthora nicotianae CJ01A1]|uniref:Uncharacterized protein n=3 Tax=Phytophthora nicotianae TaxID=4792 RepID=W2LFR2_PHYNI|nr:hypothetical protein L915_06868 [Phytophthora nicotianae]ETL95544.1 hypothetical protein L917_06683 [Phytophthora nicotianae]ETO84040.1 hypothetical protein F444_02022 [Phytophthora nicotianae P1976]ETP11682.1 hypothetical protein F441_12827 [Phytophthora nicotianae CJ01A1]